MTSINRWVGVLLLTVVLVPADLSMVPALIKYGLPEALVIV